MAAKSIPGFEHFENVWDSRAPLGWDVRDSEAVARACVALLSDWFPRTTGEIVHVDGGFAYICRLACRGGAGADSDDRVIRQRIVDRGGLPERRQVGCQRSCGHDDCDSLSGAVEASRYTVGRCDVVGRDLSHDVGHRGLMEYWRVHPYVRLEAVDAKDYRCEFRGDGRRRNGGAELAIVRRYPGEGSVKCGGNLRDRSADEDIRVVWIGEGHHEPLCVEPRRDAVVVGLERKVASLHLGPGHDSR